MNCDLCIHTNDKKYTMAKQSLSGEITHKTKPHPNALGRQIWDDTETIYWKLESGYEWIKPKQMDQLIKYAFLESSFETPLVIRKRNRPTADAQIRINWLGKKDDSYFTSPSTLAYAFGPAGGLGGDVVMNSDNLWLLRNTPLRADEAKELGYIDNYQFPDNLIKFYDPLHTMKHEGGGHALGMDHLTDQSLRYIEPMFPFYNGVRKFSQAGLDYLHQLYGQASGFHKAKEMMLNRITNFF